MGGGRGGQLLGPLLLHTQRPRMLLCGADGSGQSHLGPAVLYALEGLPVHAVGLPSLLSDASARCARHLPVQDSMVLLQTLRLNCALPPRIAGLHGRMDR